MRQPQSAEPEPNRTAHHHLHLVPSNEVSGESTPIKHGEDNNIVSPIFFRKEIIGIGDNSTGYESHIWNGVL